jgi:hypothetical protein
LRNGSTDSLRNVSHNIVHDCAKNNSAKSSNIKRKLTK